MAQEEPGWEGGRGREGEGGGREGRGGERGREVRTKFLQLH